MNVKCNNIETERLFLKRLTIDFLSENYLSWLNDSEVNKYLETKSGYTLEKLEEFLKNIERDNIYFWAIIRKDNLQHIGNIKIDPINESHKTGEYGILIGDKPSWGYGYGSEASLEVLDYCYSEKLSLRKVTLGVVSDNKAALSLYHKLGFIQEGLYEKHVFHNNKWCDIVRMAKFNPQIQCS